MLIDHCIDQQLEANYFALRCVLSSSIWLSAGIEKGTADFFPSPPVFQVGKLSNSLFCSRNDSVVY